MENLTRRAVAAQLAFTGMVLGAFDRLERDDRGQGSVEYVGIILVVVALVGAIILIAKSDTSVGNAIMSKISSAVSSIGG